MPFSKPWRNYHKGDLLYGLAGPRDQLRHFFGIKGTYAIDQYDIACVDRHNRLVFDENFINALRHHPKYRVVVQPAAGGKDLQDKAYWWANAVEAGALARRKCKGGLDWILHSTFRHIHFCLEGLNIIEVAQKSNERDSPPDPLLSWDEKKRSITGAELRWIYRNRQDAQVQSQVQFWRTTASWISEPNGQYRQEKRWQQCPPPWDDITQPFEVRAAWAGYHPTNVPPINMPQIQTFQKATDGGPTHIRNQNLKLMDRDLEAYNSLRSDAPTKKKAIKSFIVLGRLYLNSSNDSASLKATVYNYVNSATKLAQELFPDIIPEIGQFKFQIK